MRRAQLRGYMLAFEPNPLPAVEPALRRFVAPVRMVWGTADIHFDPSWADWLDRVFPRGRAASVASKARSCSSPRNFRSSSPRRLGHCGSEPRPSGRIKRSERMRA
jgi:hypothetical protein